MRIFVWTIFGISALAVALHILLLALGAMSTAKEQRAAAWAIVTSGALAIWAWVVL